MNPVVSIIIITHNREQMIRDAIASITGQTFTEWEIIVVDDGSEDRTEQVIREMNNARIRYARMARSGRLSTLRNQGIRESKGTYIAFLDSDDLFEPDKLRIQIAALENSPGSGYVISNGTYFSENGNTHPKDFGFGKKKIIIRNFFQEIIRNEISPFTCSLVFRKTCLEKTGIFDERMISGDHDFITRLAFHYTGIFCNQSLIRIRMHPENHSKLFSAGSHLEFIETLHSFNTQKIISSMLFRKLASFHHRSAATCLLKLGKPIEAKKELLESIRLNPFSYKSIGKFLLLRSKKSIV